MKNLNQRLTFLELVVLMLLAADVISDIAMWATHVK